MKRLTTIAAATVLALLSIGGGQELRRTPATAPSHVLVSTRVAEVDELDGTPIPTGPRSVVWEWGAGCVERTATSPTSIGQPVTMLAVGSYHRLALAGDGSVWGWGANRFGQLGLGRQPTSRIPTAVPELTNVISIAAGQRHSLALDADGQVWAWGDNAWGQLGDGTTELQREPVAVVGLADIRAIAAGAYHSLALDADGTVWAWGHGLAGALGDDRRASSTTPVRVADLTRVTTISAAGFHSLALQEDHTLWQWGSTIDGSDAASFAIPRLVSLPGPSDVVTMAAGGTHNLALRADSTVWAWGRNHQGQLGSVDSSARVTIPQQVPDLPPMAAVAAGELHSAALAQDGTVWAWGVDHSCRGESRANPWSPTPMRGAAEMVAISAGGAHTLALERLVVRRLPPVFAP